MTTTGGQDLKTPRLTAAEFDELLTVAEAHAVVAFRLGDLAVQFMPPDPTFPEPELAPSAQGDWKRKADLESDDE